VVFIAVWIVMCVPQEREDSNPFTTVRCQIVHTYLRGNFFFFQKSNFFCVMHLQYDALPDCAYLRNFSPIEAKYIVVFIAVWIIMYFLQERVDCNRFTTVRCLARLCIPSAFFFSGHIYSKYLLQCGL